MKPKMKTCLPFLPLLLVISCILCACSNSQNLSTPGECKTFSSFEELEQYVILNSRLAREFSLVYGTYEYSTDMALLDEAAENGLAAKTQMKAPARNNKPVYSETNVQVKGVDEADIVKSDGMYLYVLSDHKLSILRAYPARESKILSTVEFLYEPSEMYLCKNRLVIFLQTGSGLQINVLDIDNRESPRIIRKIDLEGRYITSRMIEDWAYAVVNTPVYGDNIRPPRIQTGQQVHEIEPAKTHYFAEILPHYSYTTIVSINALTGNFNYETFLTDTSHNIYASQNHIYLTSSGTLRYDLFNKPLYSELKKALDISTENNRNDMAARINELRTKLNNITPGKQAEIHQLLRQWEDEIMAHYDTTTIYKLALQNGTITYRGRGQVEGHVLNQFSMDEYDNYFRIATTKDSSGLNGNRSNNVYILNSDLRIAGKIENLAPGERIYSARFMGVKAYMVTFRQVDPLFVIDLKDPAKPRVLGELKMPGYSNYLHPVDDNHLIGIGRQVATVEKRRLPSNANMIMPPPVREQGIKIALFDATDPANPKVISEYVFAENRSDSPALHDHRAVMFSEKHHKLAIPVSLYRDYWIMSEHYPNNNQREWHGMYVFDVSVQQGIQPVGRIEHPGPVKRSLHIENGLYSISGGLIKINDFDHLDLIRAC